MAKNLQTIVACLCVVILAGCNTEDAGPGSVKIAAGSLGNIEISQSDLAPGLMNWSDAKTKAAALGTGWRLPTIEEWQTLMAYKSQIPNLKDDYWSSSEYDADAAWVIVIGDGNPGFTGKQGLSRVRAIRIP